MSRSKRIAKGTFLLNQIEQTVVLCLRRFFSHRLIGLERLALNFTSRHVQEQLQSLDLFLAQQ